MKMAMGKLDLVLQYYLMIDSKNWLLSGKSVSQILRYVTVGVASNLLGYLIYLLLTWLWLDPKVAVSMLYPFGAITAYFGHAKYSFSHEGRHMKSMPRYILTHMIGYLANISILYIFVDKLLFPHQLVQMVAVVIVAGILFFLFRYFVFSNQYVKS